MTDQQLYTLTTIIWTLASILSLISSTGRLIDDIQDRYLMAKTDVGRIMRYVWSLSWTSSILRLAASSYFIGQGFFQLTFAPVQPHLGNNLYRTIGTLALMIFVIFLNHLDKQTRNTVRKQLPLQYLIDVERAAQTMVKSHDISYSE